MYYIQGVCEIIGTFAFIVFVVPLLINAFFGDEKAKKNAPVEPTRATHEAVANMGMISKHIIGTFNIIVNYLFYKK